MITLLKICAVGLIAVVLITIVRQYRPELATAISLAAGILLLYVVIASLSEGFGYIAGLYEKLTYGREYLPVILKVLGIAYITEFAAALCKDAGETSIAAKIELAGKVAIFFAAIPVFTALLTLLYSLF